MENATIVTLSPSSGVQAVTFEEAFGEFSEARGKAKARQAARQERKIQRQENKAAKKVAKVEVRAAKKAAKQAARQERRLTRQEAKSGRQEVRQGRKATRVESRIARRNLRRPDEEPVQEDESSVAMQDTATPSPREREYEVPEADYEGTAEENNDYTEPSANSGSDYAPSEEETDYEEEGYEGEDGGDYSDEEESGYAGSEFEFDNAEGSTFGSEIADVEGNVADIQKRIQANNYLIEKIKASLNRLRQGMNQRLTEAQRNKIIQDMNGFKASLEKRLNRAIELDAQLEAFSSANGRGRRRKPVKRAGKRRHANNGVRRRVRRRRPNLTTVESGLHADIQRNRIVVPASETNSSADGIEMYATDATNEFDAPQNRVIEMKSGFDGLGTIKIGGKSISGANVLVGAALIGLGIYAAKKYKLFG